MLSNPEPETIIAFHFCHHFLEFHAVDSTRSVPGDVDDDGVVG